MIITEQMFASWRPARKSDDRWTPGKRERKLVPMGHSMFDSTTGALAAEVRA